MVSIEWRNVCASTAVDSRRGKAKQTFSYGRLGETSPDAPSAADSAVRILDNASGQLPPQSLAALVGPSGAGKTTLLNILAGRPSGQIAVSGDIFANGTNLRLIGNNNWRRTVTFCQQFDLFLGTLTVREHLRFQAMLRMPNASREARDAKVASLLHELGLDKCASNLIGNSAEGSKCISGGERKRLSLASELLTDPPVIFCDEPTSGLDSFMAASVIGSLRQLAAKGKTVLCSVHQPSSDVFGMFGWLVVVADGRSVFSGPLHQARAVFKAAGFSCPKAFNPCDHYLRVVSPADWSAGAQSNVDDLKQRLLLLQEAFRMVSALPPSKHAPEPTACTNVLPLGQHLVDNQINFLTLFAILCRRAWLVNRRDKRAFTVRVGQLAVIGFIVGMVYFHQRLDQKGVQNINGAFFLMQSNLNWQNAFAVLHVFVTEAPVIWREIENGLYGPLVYYTSRVVSLTPPYVVLPAVWTAALYFLVGMVPEIDAFLVACAVVIGFSLATVSFGCMIAMFGRDATVIIQLGRGYVNLCNIFSGIFLKVASMPTYLAWLQYLSWFRYCNEALLVNQWSRVATIACDSDPVSTGANGTWMAADELKDDCYHSGADVLQSLGFSNSVGAVWSNFVGLFMLTLAFHVIGFVVFKIRLQRLFPRSTAQ